MGRKGIRALLEEILDEEIVVDLPDGRVNKETVETALYRTAVKRALDPRNRLGMESLRFITEYVHGAPTKKVDLTIGVDPYENMSEEELYAIQERLMKGAINGSHVITPKDPTRVLESGKRDEIISGVLAARGRDEEGQLVRARGAAPGSDEADQGAREAAGAGGAGASGAGADAFTLPEGTDDLLIGPWDR